MKINIDREICSGAGQCALAAEAVFRQSPDDRLVELLDPEPGPELWSAVQEAELVCPSGAIRIDD